METQRPNRLSRMRVWRRRLTYGLLVGLSCLAGLLWHTVPAMSSAPPSLPPQLAQATLEQGQQLYQAGQRSEAIRVLQQVADTASSPAERVVALRNLALVYQQLGQWPAAATAIAAARSTLPQTPASSQPLLQAQLLEVEGSLHLDQGQGEAAIATWTQAAELYTELDRPEAVAQAHINQAQAMQRLGFHRQAIATLQPVVEGLAAQPDSLMKAVALRTLGDSLVQAGNLGDAEKALLTSLTIANTLSNPGAASTAALSLGNLQTAQGDTAAALAYYADADVPAALPIIRVKAQLNRLAVLAETGAIAQAQALWPQLLTQLNAFTPGQETLFAKINLAETLMTLPGTSNPSPRQIADLLASTIQEAKALGDRRSESLATGALGHLYESLEQWPEAAELSQSALGLAQSINATDILYRWQWQLGRIYKAEKQSDPAIAAYSDAVDTLKRLRTDLVAVNPAVQVSFQKNVEPIHRELVSLLLEPGREVTPADLETARDTIESLQLAELDNFFREACLDAAQIDIDQLDQRAAVVYPVILSDRLEIIVSLPDQPLKHYPSPIELAEFNETIEQFRFYLVLRIGRQYLPFAQQLYDWVMRPAIADLDASGVDTLVFVLDGELRNIPMATLHDGSQFLLERYNLALTPGLQLVDSRPLQGQALRVVTAGLSESRQGFSALPNVVEEVEQIQATVPASTILLNDGFTATALESTLNFQEAPIVHLATHGKFSSSNEETFVLTWDDRLNISALNNLLQTAELNQRSLIELLVLSACETAAGDRQAALGLAGMAVRSGARSTIATLWQVNDEATARLMTELYNNLASDKLSKAEALRQAQLTVLQIPEFRQHPFYWAPYVLVGNWL